MPATESLNTFTLFVDTLGNLDTGLALVNVDPVAVAGPIPEVTLSLFDTEFAQIATTQVPIGAGGAQGPFHR